MRLLALALALALTGCAAQKIDVAVFPAGIYSAQNVDDAATYDALNFFSGRSLHPTQAQAARVRAAVEYLGGEIASNDRFNGLAATTRVQFLQARDEVRQALAITPGTSSQAIVDALVAAARAPTSQALLTALDQPFFTLGAQATAARLSALPPMPITRTALEKLWSYEYRTLDAT